MHFSVWVIGELKFPRKGGNHVDEWRKLPLNYASYADWPDEGFFSTEDEPESKTVGEALDQIAALQDAGSSVPRAQPLSLSVKGSTVALSGFLSKDQFLDLHHDLGAAIRRAGDVGATGAIVMAEEIGDFAYRFRVAKGKSTFEELSPAELQAFIKAGVIPKRNAKPEVPPVARQAAETREAAQALTKALATLSAEEAELHRRILEALDRATPETIADAARRAGAALSVQLKGGKHQPLGEVFQNGVAIREALRKGADVLELGSSIWVDALLRTTFALLWEIDPASAESIAVDALAPGRAYGVLRSEAARLLGRSSSDAALASLIDALQDHYIGGDAGASLGRMPHPSAGERLLVAVPDGLAPASPSDRPDEQRRLTVIAQALGARRFTEAGPRLLAIWRELPPGNLRAALGEALLRIGTPEVLEALAQRWDSDHGAELNNAVRATFELDPKCAYDRFARFFDEAALATREGKSVTTAIFHILEKTRASAAGQGWIQVDPRWTDLALQLLDREGIGWNALQALPYMKDERVLPAILARLEKDDLEDVCDALVKLGDLAAIPALEARLATTKKKGDAARLRETIAHLHSRSMHV